MISTAEALSARYQSLGGQLAQMNDGINGEIKASVADINSYAEQIASLNQQIGLAQAGFGQPANDLLDSRDQLILELNRLIRAKTTSNSDGSVNVLSAAVSNWWSVPRRSLLRQCPRRLIRRVWWSP
jgi:flagellar hook-associated protein 1 FlgK